DMTFGIDGSVLTETGADGSTLTKERFGKPPAVEPTLAGVWRYRHDTGALAYERYADDGTFHFRLPMRSVTGCFALDGDRLRLAPQAASQTVMTISWRAGDLVYPAAGKTRSTGANRRAPGTISSTSTSSCRADAAYRDACAR